MIYQFEHEGFTVCGDCPCWFPDEMHGHEPRNFPSEMGVCYLCFEDRSRFDDKPDDCPLMEVEPKPDCENAEKQGDACLGYGHSDTDDEPIDACKNCEKYQGYGVE